MTKERLKDYRSKKKEIRELRKEIEHLHEDASMIVSDVILNYNSGYPVPQTITGFDKNRYDRIKKRKENRIQRLIEECEEVECFVDEIPDSITRRAFKMTFLEGKSQTSAALSMSVDHTSISKKINNYLKLAKKSK